MKAISLGVPLVLPLVVCCVGGCGRPAAQPTPATSSGPPDLRVLSAQVRQNLPDAPRDVVVENDGRNGEPLRVFVSWSRPGYPLNRASFTAVRTGDEVRVSVRDVGEWKFRGEKMTDEKALGTNPNDWEWVRGRAKEVALVTAKLPR